jgi:hypothetical protein
MALEYKLVPDPTCENPDQHRAVVVNQKEVTLDDIIDKMAEEGRLKVSKKETKAIFESYMAAIYLAHIDGEKVRTPLFNVTENGIEPGPVLQRAAENIEVKKVE